MFGTSPAVPRLPFELAGVWGSDVDPAWETDLTPRRCGSAVAGCGTADEDTDATVAVGVVAWAPSFASRLFRSVDDAGGSVGTAALDPDPFLGGRPALLFEEDGGGGGIVCGGARATASAVLVAGVGCCLVPFTA